MLNGISENDLAHQRELIRCLEPDEQLIWSGKPKTGIVFKKSDIGSTLLALLWITFFSYLVWVEDVITTSAFIPIGVYLLILRYPVDSKRRSLTYYGLTDRRIIILSGFFRRNIKSIPLDCAAKLEISERRGSFGTVVINPGNLLAGSVRSSIVYYSKIPETYLEFLVDYEEVKLKIIEAKKELLDRMRLESEK